MVELDTLALLRSSIVGDDPFSAEKGPFGKAVKGLALVGRRLDGGAQFSVVEIMQEKMRPDHPSQFLKRLVNGLITNDKFCLSRTVHLQLSWSRLPFHRHRIRTNAMKYPLLDERTHQGGSYEEPSMASTPAPDRAAGWTAAMESSLSTALLMEQPANSVRTVSSH
jgi:hypothetical protein